MNYANLSKHICVGKEGRGRGKGGRVRLRKIEGWRKEGGGEGKA